MLYQTRKTLMRPDWSMVLLFLAAWFLCFIGFGGGFSHGIVAQEPCEWRECVVGFASVEDMLRLAGELEECQKWGVPQ